MNALYAGPVDKLIDIVRDVVAGKEAVLTAEKNPIWNLLMDRAPASDLPPGDT